MASINQLRGLLLEEVILVLLRSAGYRTISIPGNDPTLSQNSAGLTVQGRGAKHQIDAIADLKIGLPFSNPHRLLVEAKAYSNLRPIGLPIIRGAVGVLKDVSEFWIPNTGTALVGRYHYQMAIFSSSNFASPAQEYAFAHEIYLLPLGRSAYFSPVLRALDEATRNLPTTEAGQVTGINLTDVRNSLRYLLQPAITETRSDENYPWLSTLVEATAKVGNSLIAILGRSFPIFLTPRPGLDLNTVHPNEMVRIHFNDSGNLSGWNIGRTNGEQLFTFDLPELLFKSYATAGTLSPKNAFDLKEAYFREITAIYSDGEDIKLFAFRLDHNWLEEIQENILTTLPRRKDE